MNEAWTVIHLCEDVMIHSTAAREEGRTPDYAQFLDRAVEGRRRVQKCCDVLVLAGPRSVKHACDLLTEAASGVYTAVRGGDERRLAAAVGGLMQGRDALQRMGART